MKKLIAILTLATTNLWALAPTSMIRDIVFDDIDKVPKHLLIMQGLTLLDDSSNSSYSDVLIDRTTSGTVSDLTKRYNEAYELGIELDPRAMEKEFLNWVAERDVKSGASYALELK